MSTEAAPGRRFTNEEMLREIGEVPPPRGRLTSEQMLAEVQRDQGPRSGGRLSSEEMLATLGDSSSSPAPPSTDRIALRNRALQLAGTDVPVQRAGPIPSRGSAFDSPGVRDPLLDVPLDQRIRDLPPGRRAFVENVSGVVGGALGGVMTPVSEMAEAATGGSPEEKTNARRMELFRLEEIEREREGLPPSGPQMFAPGAKPRGPDFYAARALQAGVGMLPPVAALSGTFGNLEQQIAREDEEGGQVPGFARGVAAGNREVGEGLEWLGERATHLTGSETVGEVAKAAPFIAGGIAAGKLPALRDAALRTPLGQRLAPRAAAERVPLAEPRPAAPSAEVRGAASAPREVIPPGALERLPPLEPPRVSVAAPEVPKFDLAPSRGAVELQTDRTDFGRGLIPETDLVVRPRGTLPSAGTETAARPRAPIVDPELLAVPRALADVRDGKVRAWLLSPRGGLETMAEARLREHGPPRVARSLGLATYEASDGSTVFYRPVPNARRLVQQLDAEGRLRELTKPEGGIRLDVVKPEAERPISPRQTTPETLGGERAPPPRRLVSLETVERGSDAARTGVPIQARAETAPAARGGGPVPLEARRPAPETAEPVRRILGGDEAPVVRVPVESIKTDPARFQFKENVDPRTGAGRRLRDVEKFDRDLGGVVLTWKDPASGETFVVNGHHRLELARRAGAKDIDVRYIDAPTAEAARARGALTNIAEGSGTATDAAKLFRDLDLEGDQLRTFLRERGVSLSGGVARQGAALANLDPALFEDVAVGRMKPEIGVAIGEAGLDRAGQHALAQAVSRGGIAPEEIPALARRVKDAATVTETQAGLFGPESLTRSAYDVEAKLETGLVKALGADRRIFSAAAKNAEELARGENVINRARSQEIADAAGTIRNAVQKLVAVKGPLADAISETAREVKAGRRTLADAIERLKARAQDAVAQELGSRAPAGTVPAGGAAEATLFGEPAAPKVVPPPFRFGRRSEQGAVGDVPGGVSGAKVAEAARLAGGGARTLGKRLAEEVSRSVAYLRKYGPAGEKLSEKVTDVLVDTRRGVGRDMLEFTQAIRQVPVRERGSVSRRLRGMVEGTEAPRTPQERNLVATVRRIFARVARELNEAGVRIEDDRTGPRPVRGDWAEYFPQKLKHEVIERLRQGDPEMIARLHDLNVGAGKRFRTAAELDAALEMYHARSPEGFFGGVELPRRVKYPADWMEADGLHTVASYLERAHLDAAEHRHFRYRPDPAGPKGQGELGDLLAKIRRQAPQSGDAAEAGTIVARIFGRSPEDLSTNATFWQRAATVEGLLTAGRLFIGNVKLPLQQISQLRNSLTLFGEKHTAIGLGRSIGKLKVAKETAIREGAIRPESYLTRMGFDDSPGGRGLRKARGVIDTLTKPIALADEFWRTVASEAVPSWAVELGADLRRGPRNARAQKARRILQKLDMTAAEVSEIASGDVSPRTLTKLRQRAVSQSQVESGAADRPRLMHGPLAAVAGRLKTFGIGDARFGVKFALDEARHGNLAPVGRYVVYTVAVGETLAAAYSTMFGPRDRPSIEEIVRTGDPRLLAKRMTDDLMLASFFGILGGAVASLFPTSGDRPETDKFFTNTLKPPSADLIEDALRLYESAFDREDDDDEPQTRAGRRAKIRREATLGGEQSERAGALWRFVRGNLAGVNQGAKIVEMATPRGIALEARDRSKVVRGRAVPRKGQERTVEALRERYEALHDLLDTLGIEHEAPRFPVRR